MFAKVTLAILLACAAVTTRPVQADPVQTTDVPEIVEQATPSVVTITFQGRNGKRLGLGSGFIVRKNGLIATNLHVLGEARPIAVTLSDGRRFDVEEVFATNKQQDLAVLKIEAADLQPLTLGRSPDVRSGQDVVAIGHPLGRSYSVARGIVSAVREEIGGRPMVQLSMNIERGNSGGPVLNADGEVIGIVTLKSLETDDLGYAVPVDALSDLLESPNPTPMSRWLTIGRLDDSLWSTPDDDVRWRQRNGQVLASGRDRNIGGRSICLSTRNLPTDTYEVSAVVKIDEEDGAAGLCFAVNDSGQHYGFYPSSGRLRLARFDGSSVYSWNVLGEKSVDSYQHGEWNHLRVRVTPQRLTCWCNDEQVFEFTDAVYRSGSVGFVKFRHTTAAYKQFQLGENVPQWRPTQEIQDALAIAVEQWRLTGKTDEIRNTTSGDPRSEQVLDDLARRLEKDAEQLRQLKQDFRADRVRRELVETLESDANNRLLNAAILLGALDSDDVSPEASLTQFARLADELSDSINESSDGELRRAALNRFFFREWGFHGGRTNYYSRSNSFLSEALDDREGLPITLSVLYAAFAREVNLDVVGVGLPGHFVVRYQPTEGESELIDVFEGGKTITLGEAATRVMGNAGRPLMLNDLAAQTDSEIILRMLRNLIGGAERDEDVEASLRYAKTIVALDPEAVADRLYVAIQCYNTGRYCEGLEQLDAAVALDDGSLPSRRVEQLREAMMSRSDCD